MSTNADAVPNSIYWFSQHGDSLQWLIYEDQDGRIVAFQWFQSPKYPRTIIQYADGNPFDGTTKVQSLQSETVSNTSFAMYGSNLYLVNGQDAPLVFDGKKCTRAGFSGKPNSPTPYTTSKTEIRASFNFWSWL
jgi:hypothetical protein